MSNLLIETSAINTIPKSLSFKHSSGNFDTSLSSPFPKAGNLKCKSLKLFVLQLFGKFILFSPTLMGCRRFHFTQKVGLWTLLTSNPSNALSAMLETGGNGGWLTTVARWHMWCYDTTGSLGDKAQWGAWAILGDDTKSCGLSVYWFRWEVSGNVRWFP